MSVAIAAPQAKLPTSTAPTDRGSTTDTAAAGTDFASLLLGQLAAGTALLLPAAEDAQPQADIGKEISTELTSQDAALLLAALGLAQPPLAPPKSVDAQPLDDQALPVADNALLTSPRIQDIQLPGQVGNALSDPLKNAAVNILPNKSGELEVKSETGSGSTSFLAAMAAKEGAAKIAVTDLSLPKEETLPAGLLSDQAPVGGATNTSPHPTTQVHRNEATLKVETPIRNPNWAGDFSQKIVWLASNDKQVAELTINPPQMGPIEISLSLNKDGASAFFVSQNAEVREAIEAALPRLREMFAEAGIELGKANVGAESSRQQAGNEEASQGKPRWMTDNAILGGDSVRNLSGQAIMTLRGNGLVDTFA